MANSMKGAPSPECGSFSLTNYFGKTGLEALARQTGFQQRTARKLCAESFLVASLHSALSGKSSYQQVAVGVGLAAETTVSRQNLAKRTDKKAVDFLAACLGRVLAGLPETNARAARLLPAGIQRVLVADSTVVSLHPSLAAEFPGPANQLADKQAAARIQVVLDLLEGTFVDFNLGSFRDNDQKAAGLVGRWVRAGDLVLRDLGYFTLGSLREIDERGAFFISRLRSGTTLFDEEGKTIDLLAELRGAGDTHELRVQLGAQARLPVRLVAVRLSAEEAARRRRKAKANRDKRLNPSAARLELLGWSITLDNLPEEIPAQRIYPIYALRWRVEIVFKTWKSHLGLHRPLHARAGRQQARAAFCAFLTAAALVAWAHAQLAEQHCATARGQLVPALSLLKTAPLITAALARMILPALEDPQAISRQILYHCRYEKRRKRKNFEEALLAALFKSCVYSQALS